MAPLPPPTNQQLLNLEHEYEAKIAGLAHELELAKSKLLRSTNLQAPSSSMGLIPHLIPVTAEPLLASTEKKLYLKVHWEAAHVLLRRSPWFRRTNQRTTFHPRDSARLLRCRHLQSRRLVACAYRLSPRAAPFLPRDPARLLRCRYPQSRQLVAGALRHPPRAVPFLPRDPAPLLRCRHP